MDLGGRPEEGAAAARAAELFERHGATVLGLCRVLLPGVHEAEDAVQQTFLAAYRSLLNGNEPRHPAAWLATIARNECWALAQRRLREPVSEDGHGTESRFPDPVAAAAARADLAELCRAIGDLPQQQRQALLLREFSGLSYEELAEALSVSEPAVESLLVRARRQVRLRLRPAFRTTAAVIPFVGGRLSPWRLIEGGLPCSDSGGSGLAKLAAGAAAVVVAGGTVAAVDTLSRHDRAASPPARVAPAPDRIRVQLTPQRRAEPHATVAAAAPGRTADAVMHAASVADPGPPSPVAPSRVASVPPAARTTAPRPVAAPAETPARPTALEPPDTASVPAAPSADPAAAPAPEPDPGGTSGDDGAVAPTDDGATGETADSGGDGGEVAASESDAVEGETVEGGHGEHADSHDDSGEAASETESEPD